MKNYNETLSWSLQISVVFITFSDVATYTSWRRSVKSSVKCKNGRGKKSNSQQDLEKPPDAGVQGGIALTSPPCIKKTDQRSNEKAGSVYQTNCEMAVVKAAS